MPWTRSKPATQAVALSLALGAATACGFRTVEPEVEPCEHRSASACERDGLPGCPCDLDPTAGVPDLTPACEDEAQACFQGYCVDVECQEPLERHLCEAGLECGIVADVDACVVEAEQCLASLDAEAHDIWLGTAYGCLAYSPECQPGCLEYLLGCPP